LTRIHDLGEKPRAKSITKSVKFSDIKKDPEMTFT